MGRRDVTAPLRGQVFRVKLASGMTPVVVISNVIRNRSLSTVLAVRVTTAPKPSMPTIVELPVGEPIVGRVMCDEVAELTKAALQKPAGGLSRKAMARMDEGLRIALALGEP